MLVALKVKVPEPFIVSPPDPRAITFPIVRLPPPANVTLKFPPVMELPLDGLRVRFPESTEIKESARRVIDPLKLFDPERLLRAPADATPDPLNVSASPVTATPPEI